MSDAIGIGYFQFDNLVRNRVPFCLLTLDGVQVEKHFDNQDRAHLLRYQRSVEESTALDQAQVALQEFRYRKIDPILVICEDGKKSQTLADQLGHSGYLNCYFLEGGYLQFLLSLQSEAKA